MVKNFTFKKNVVYEFRFSLNKSYRLQKPYYLNNRYLLEISMYQIEDYVNIADNSVLGILKSLKPPYARGSIENTDRQDMKRHSMEANPTTGRLFYESFP